MCQLTLLELSDQKIARNIIRPLIEINTLGIGLGPSNHDGFGYMTFAQIGEVYKSKDSGEIWWNSHDKEFRKKHRNVNGIYHVRAASTNLKKIEDEFAHPFKLNNLILTHNGTIHFRSHSAPDKDLIGDLPKDITDSQEFLYVLELLSLGRPLTPDIINRAIKNFRGLFVFMIWDKLQPKKVFIVRGEDRFLHKSEFYIDEKEPVGILLNTMKWELRHISRQICYMANALGQNMTYKFEELDKFSIYEYKLGSFHLGNPIAKVDKVTIIQQSWPAANTVVGFLSGNTPGWIEAEIHANNLSLTYVELLVLSELLFGKTFLLFDKEEMEYFAEALTEFDEKHNHKGRLKLWNKIKNKTDASPIELYKTLDLEFPYFFNSKSSMV